MITLPTLAVEYVRANRRQLAIVLLAFAAGLLFAGCAAPPPAPQPPAEPQRAAIFGAPGEDQLHLLARILVDGCTSEETDEVLIQHAMLLLASCRPAGPGCIRRVCARLDSPPTFPRPLAYR